MRAGLFWLNDRQWARIEPHLPTGLTGPGRDDDRRIVSGIIHMLQSGARWRDCPREYGPCTTVYNRFNRWAKRGRWSVIFEALAKPGKDAVALSLDSTSIKAHRCASGGKGGSTIKQSAARAEAARRNADGPESKAYLKRHVEMTGQELDRWASPVTYASLQMLCSRRLNA